MHHDAPVLRVAFKLVLLLILPDDERGMGVLMSDTLVMYDALVYKLQ